MKDILIRSRERDLGGFSVRRSLPAVQRGHVGPFVFLDLMGPMTIDETHVLDVRPHPHIGLATVTYLFEGRGFHRDSIGSSQVILPGDLNWMTSGRGIVHSEHTPEEDRNPADKKVMHGVQIWVGLPTEMEECQPNFAHWSKDKLPEISITKDIKAKLLLGQYGSSQSPVQTLSPTLFMDVKCDVKTSETFSFKEEEIGIFIVTGSGKLNGQPVGESDLVIVSDTKKIQLQLSAKSRFLILGGKPFPEPRFIWWNFVSSSKERIHKAAQDWENQVMGKIPDEDTFIPLPKDPLP